MSRDTFTILAKIDENGVSIVAFAYLFAAEFREVL